MMLMMLLLVLFVVLPLLAPVLGADSRDLRDHPWERNLPTPRM